MKLQQLGILGIISLLSYTAMAVFSPHGYPGDKRFFMRRNRHDHQGTITRTCRSCGKTFTLPENVQYWPDYCQECRAKAPAQTITRKCRSCGKEFTFLSTENPWPDYCRDCHSLRYGEKRK